MQENELNNLMRELKNAKDEKNVSPETIRTAMENLPETQKSKINALLQDPQKLKILLDSPIAQKMISELRDK